MCSFLLLFLLLIVGFDSIRNYNPNWNTEKAESTAASGGTSRLVLTPERSGDIERGAPQEDQTHAVCSPFQGQQVFAENLKEDHGDGVVAVAMWTLPTHQQKAGYKVCNMLCTLDEWYSSQYRTQATAAASGECQLEGLGRMVPGVGRLGEHRCSPSLGQSSIEVTVPSQHKKCEVRCAQASQQQKGGKGKHKGKSKGGKNKSKDIASSSLGQSPFTPLATELPPWPSLEGAASNLMPTVPPSSTPFMVAQANETIAQKREVVNALKTAYTDSAMMPQDTKDLIVKMENDIEKLEKEHSKATTKNLHSATTALGKAQKTPDRNVGGQTCTQVTLDQTCCRSCEDLGGTAARISPTASLTAGGSSKSSCGHRKCKKCHSNIVLKSDTCYACSDASYYSNYSGDGGPDPRCRRRGGAMQQQLQTVLQSCAASLGVELPLQGPNKCPTEMESDLPDPTLTDQSRQKRPRSLEPFGGGAPSVSSAEAKAM